MYSTCAVIWLSSFSSKICTVLKLGSVAGPVVQANGRLTFEDQLRLGGLLCQCLYWACRQYGHFGVTCGWLGVKRCHFCLQDASHSAKRHRQAAVGHWVSLCVTCVVGWLIVYQDGNDLYHGQYSQTIGTVKSWGVDQSTIQCRTIFWGLAFGGAT